MTTKEAILFHTAQLLAAEGAAGTSMRKVATAVNREPSVIYSHFADKEALLRATRQYITSQLDTRMQAIPASSDTRQYMKRVLHFQLENRTLIVALLQYFMATRDDFQKNEHGYVPLRAYQHMREIISQGIEDGTYVSDDVAFDAKAITHLVNGFLMEYFDRELSRKELQELAEQLAGCVDRLLTRQEPVHAH